MPRVVPRVASVRVGNVSALLYRRICPLLTAYVMAIVTAPQARAQVPRAQVPQTETLWTHFVEPTEPPHGYAGDLTARFLRQASGVGPCAMPAIALAEGAESLVMGRMERSW